MRKTRPAKPVPASEKPAPGRLRAAVKSPRGGRPTKDEAEQLGSRILTAAAELFAQQGFAATSMAAITSRR
ncbi:TetR family transcriptional regulator [Methylobacterium brachiatum]|uniref:TetR family transcriptional regulator n=1 Tax=Methylobacterium brachiatum TaxID=269660 RepID=UPI0033148C3E